MCGKDDWRDEEVATVTKSSSDVECGRRSTNGEWYESCKEESNGVEIFVDEKWIHTPDIEVDD